MMLSDDTDYGQLVKDIISSHFPAGTYVVDYRRDPEERGYFVILDDPSDEFEFVEIYVGSDGTWDS